MQGRREFERDWRDWFIMGVVGGAVGWVAVTLAKVCSVAVRGYRMTGVNGLCVCIDWVGGDVGA